MSNVVSRVVSSRAAWAFVVACVAAIGIGCASDRAPGPAYQDPSGADGEVVRGPAPAAEVIEASPADAPTGVAKLDWNADGHVDREEFRNYFARVFHAADADDDRVLRGPELAAVPPESVASADHDGNGGLDVAEYVDLALVWFVRCDANGDDVLGPDEDTACAAAASAQK